MTSKLGSLLVGSLLAISLTGCAVCCAPFDDDYNAFGGCRDRMDRTNGRVGSAFEPADATVQTNDNVGTPPLNVAQMELTDNEDDEVNTEEVADDMPESTYRR